MLIILIEHYILKISRSNLGLCVYKFIRFSINKLTHVYVYIWSCFTKHFCLVLLIFMFLFKNNDVQINHLIIIIMLCRQHGYPWHYLATPPNRSLLLAGPQGYIPYPHSAAVFRFDLLLFGYVRGSIGAITYELVSASPAVSCMSGSSNLDSFPDGRQVAVQLVLCGVLPPGLVQNCSQHSCVVAVKLFLHPFC